jgi:hypothetical protein
MDVSGHLHAPDILPPKKKKKTYTHWLRGWVGPRAGVDSVAKRKKVSFPWRESNPSRPARSLVAIRTELSQLRPVFLSAFLCKIFCRGCLKWMSSWQGFQLPTSKCETDILK